MLILPAVLGVVSVLIPADSGLGPGPVRRPLQNKDAGTILLILAVGACFAGAANSVRELIKERVIYERERAVGLSRSAYLMSKVIVLGLITAAAGRDHLRHRLRAAQDARPGRDPARHPGGRDDPGRSWRSASPR